MPKAPFFDTDYNVRGFRGFKFKDEYGNECRIQKSSAACYDAIWLGVMDAKPQIMKRYAAQFGINVTEPGGWVEYPIPSEVLLTTDMHLTQNQVRRLLPVLQHFAEHGSLPSFEEAQAMSDSVELVEEEY